MKCNMNCFNCEFSDCVNDKITKKEIREVNSRDRKETSAQERYKRYYKRHREERVQRSLEYYYAHREECKQKMKEYHKRKKEERDALREGRL